MKPKSVVALLFASIAVVACGGGGGGGGSSASLQPTAVITDANALAITREILFPTELFGTDNIPGLANSTTVYANASVVTNAQPGLAALLNSRLIREFPTTLANGADPLATYACDFSGTADLVYLSQTRLRITFNDCDGFAEAGFTGLINGVVELQDNNPAGTLVEDITLIFRDFTLEANGSVTGLDGDLRSKLRNLTDGNEYLHEVEDFLITELAITLNQQTSTFLNYDSRFETLSSPSEDFQQEDFTGSLRGGTFTGLVNFSTPVPFVYDYLAGEIFTQGKLVVDGANDSSIVVEFDGTGAFDVQIDVDGDGLADFTPDWTLSDLSDLY